MPAKIIKLGTEIKITIKLLKKFKNNSVYYTTKILWKKLTLHKKDTFCDILSTLQNNFQIKLIEARDNSETNNKIKIIMLLCNACQK